MRALPLSLRPDSLTFRVIAFSTVWAIITVALIATVISTLFRQSSEQGFENLLSAHMFNLISTVSASPEGSLRGDPNLGDLRFSVPRSGWYWSVEPVSEGLSGELKSLSMIEPIPSATPDEVPFDASFQRRYVAHGLDGELIDVFESEFVLDDLDRIARFRMMGNRSELEEEMAAFDRQIYFYLAIFGFGMIAINAIAILIGLTPLARVRRALADIRSGSAGRLDGRFPAEIAPLADETNALIESNRRIVERSRTQVGNLAHSLKTPLAVLLNEGKAMGGTKGNLIVQQTASMTAQVEHYLQRARIAAQRDTVVFRTPVMQTIDRMVSVLRKLNPHLRFEWARSGPELIFSGEREDLEEIAGNLLENAAKWAASLVRVEVRALGGEDAGRFELAIEDDGPGIPDALAQAALRRGVRLDETKPGTGLGLSIVADLVGENDGTITLREGALGGLRAVIRLQRSRNDVPG